MSIPKTFIRNIIFPLRKNYVLDNTPVEKNGSAQTRFIGRKKHIEKLKRFLAINRGVFLVTGYRGMGKTSFVNHVLSEMEAEGGENKLKPVNLTIAHNKPAEYDVLRQVVISVYEAVKKEAESKIFVNNEEKEKTKDAEFRMKKWLVIAGVINLVLLLLFIFPKFTENYLSGTFLQLPFFEGLNIGKLISYASLFLFLLLIIIHLVRTEPLRRLKHALKNNELYQRVKWTTERAFTTVSEDSQPDSPIELDIKGIKTGIFEKKPRRIKGFPIASSKEMEYELKAILDDAKGKGFNFVFIFDELDKIEFAEGAASLYQDLNSFEAGKNDIAFLTQQRQRKQAVMSIIAGLKNFFTTSKASFIFIAGREMFDASLADISDKQSPLSSIFTYTFNIESFLKEEEGYAGEKSIQSLTNAIEEFLKYQLCTRKDLAPGSAITITGNNGKSKTVEFKQVSFFDYIKYQYGPENPTSGLTHGEFGKLYFMLQAFVTYLAYRSNGSPKKLLKTFHEFVKVGDHKEFIEENKKEQYIIPGCKSATPYGRCFLYFSYNDQYRIWLINYFYRGFLIQKGRSFKLYSDNAIISVPYLFDHLFKFHPFAFSRPNLELVPELLSANKAPAIKEDLDQIISYLSNTHLRDTEIELFEYKFNSRSSNELSFLSRVFEEEAAAFNFTLDESYAVKLFLNEKIKELRSIYSRFYKDSDAVNQQIFSIAYHNGNLGDLHFFDQEYDDAISNYSDAIRPINTQNMEKMNFRDFITLVRNKLKTGLCFEKINSYEEALMFYTDASIDTKRFITHHLYKADPLNFSFLAPGSGATAKPASPESFITSSLSDLLQIVIQCFVSKLYIQEKMGMEGLTNNKIKLELAEFLQLIDGVGYKCGQNHMQTANFFLHLGKLAYYKNSSGANRHSNKDPEVQDNYPGWMSARFKALRSKFENAADFEKHSVKRQPTLALAYYIIGLDEVLRCRTQGWKPAPNLPDSRLLYDNGAFNILPEYFQKLQNYLESGNERYTSNHYKSIAGFLSSIGDCILSRYSISSCRCGESPNEKNGQKDFNWKISAGEIFNENHFEGDGENKLLNALQGSHSDYYSMADVFRCYYLAAKYYKKAGRIPAAGFEYSKILHVLRIVSRKGPEDNLPFNSRVIALLGEQVVQPALQMMAQGTGRANRHMAIKAQVNIPSLTTDFINNNIAVNPDIREINLLLAYVKLKLEKDPSPAGNNIDENNSITTQFIRLLELDFYMGHLYVSRLRELLRNKVFSGAVIAKEHLDLAVEYLFSANMMIRTLRIYGTDYMLGHSFVAFTYFRMAEFIREANLTKEGETALREKLELVLGRGSMVLTDYRYHYEKAADHYERAIQLHTAGHEYRKTVRDMIYLEDDFTDSAFHFGAALDRYLMVRGVFEKNINTCKNYMG